MSNSKCIYCGSSAYGSAIDFKHPQKVHQHLQDGKSCIYCGSSASGNANDFKHPNKVHQMG